MSINYNIAISANFLRMSNNQKVTPSYMGIKAGMDSVNREVIAQKVADLTKGTPKDLHEK